MLLVHLVKKTDGSLWAWGSNERGALGLNQGGNPSQFFSSSPTQIGNPGDWSTLKGMSVRQNVVAAAVKTDGSLYVWGYNTQGILGLNNRTSRSSPTQLGTDTTWKEMNYMGEYGAMGIKTDGTLWSWGYNYKGQLGLNQSMPVKISSPTQIGSGTDWDRVGSLWDGGAAMKTDGQLWVWGANDGHGQLGLNDRTERSSPCQVPGVWQFVSQSYGGFGRVTQATRKA